MSMTLENTGYCAALGRIEYDLRENGIQPQKLFELNNFGIILCKDLESGDNFEKKKYEEFKKDISRMSTSALQTISNSL